MAETLPFSYWGFQTDHPLRLFSFLWESQFTVESGSLDLKFESDNDANEIWEVVMACTMQYLEQCWKFCRTSTFWEFTVWLNGNTSVNEKFYYNNLNNFSLQVSSGKSWKQYALSSAVSED